MRKASVLPLIALSLGLFAAAANSTPSTLIWIPSTDIQADKTGHAGIDCYAPSEGQALLDYGVTFGAKRLEYGFDILSINGIQDPVRLNAKYLVLDEKGFTPRLAVGVYDYGMDAASNICYALASKTFPLARLTAGFGVGKKSVLGEDREMAFLGLDRSLGGKWWGAVDYQSGKSSFGAFSAGVSYNFTSASSLIVGYDWYNDENLSDTWTIQWDCNF